MRYEPAPADIPAELALAAIYTREVRAEILGPSLLVLSLPRHLGLLPLLSALLGFELLLFVAVFWRYPRLAQCLDDLVAEEQRSIGGLVILAGIAEKADDLGKVRQ